jgi:hypothetical protein
MSGGAISSRLMVLPLNYTGRVDLNLSATYCDRSTKITRLSYNHTDKLTAAREFNSTTSRATNSLVTFELPKVKNATLVPLDSPPVWKAGSTELVQGRATAQYDPEVFRPSRNITYTVFQGGEAIGVTKVSLKAANEIELIERLVDAEILITSLLLNIVLSMALAATYRQSLKRALTKLQ